MRPFARAIIIALALLSPLALHAQTRIDIGLAFGTQPYANAAEDPRYLTSADVLLRRESIGLHVAVEYADLPEGALIVTHVNPVYRHEFGGPWFAMAGAGLTSASIGQSGHRTTWNAELELGRRWPRVDVFARVRQYDFELQRFREGDAGPDGPAAYLGVRFRIRG